VDPGGRIVARHVVGLSGVAAMGLLLILLVMPETRRTSMIAPKEMAG